MGTLESVQQRFTGNDELRNMLAFIGADRIVLREPSEQDMEVALMDLDEDGVLDTVAVDLFGQGNHFLYIVDTDMDNIPDMAYYEIAETGLLEQLDSEISENAGTIRVSAQLFLHAMDESSDPSEIISQLGEIGHYARRISQRLLAAVQAGNYRKDFA